MRVMVCPHTMEIGGSQMNAIELAAAVRDRGHEVIVYSETGPLLDKVRAAGLEHIERKPSRISPGPATARDLHRLIRHRDIDIVHGYEWPPILEAYAAAAAPGGRAAAVGTVMSMAIAPFLPRAMPLVVGTKELRDDSAARRRGAVTLIEPPVDTSANTPACAFAPPADLAGLDPSAVRIAIVARLVPELKLEGILTAVEATGRLAADRSIQLVIVGDGSARAAVAAGAERVNAAHGRTVVVLAGESMDPRWAYGSADICIGMGGSALRAAAFAKPLIVQGEGGFFELLDDRTLPLFLEQGWYGVADRTSEQAVVRLTDTLRTLTDDAGFRGSLGDFGRQLILDRFSLVAAAAVQEQVYSDALAERPGMSRVAVDSARSFVGLALHKVRRRVERMRGRRAVDDFNARRAAAPPA